MTAKSLDVVLHTLKHLSAHLIEFRYNRCSKLNSCHILQYFTAANLSIIFETTKEKGGNLSISALYCIVTIVFYFCPHSAHRHNMF